MTKHTPGPWNAARAGWNMATNYSQSWAIGELHAPNLVAGVFSDVRGGEAVAEANARLIAAAPNMLAALILAEVAADPTATVDERAKAKAAIRAAIAKAAE